MSEAPSARAIHIEYVGRVPVSDHVLDAVIGLLSAEVFVESVSDGPEPWDQESTDG